MGNCKMATWFAPDPASRFSDYFEKGRDQIYKSGICIIMNIQNREIIQFGWGATGWKVRKERNQYQEYLTQHNIECSVLSADILYGFPIKLQLRGCPDSDAISSQIGFQAISGNELRSYKETQLPEMDPFRNPYLMESPGGCCCFP